MTLERWLLKKKGLPLPISPTGTITFREMELFKLKYRREAPYLYWFFRTLPRWYAQQKNKGTGVLAYIHNRWINPSHIIKIHHPDIIKGHYRDSDTIMLYAMFQLLVDYVEIECGRAGFYESWYEKVYTWFRDLPIIGWFLPPIRNKRQGLHYLRWCMKLTSEHPSQAHHGKQVFKLYKWWTKERPTRKDPFNEYCEKREFRDWGGSLTPTEKKALDKATRLESRYEKEDARMLKLLVSIRKGMWT